MSKQKSLHEPMAIPEAFLETHYCQAHVMLAMEWSEETFWAAYVAGGVPRGVSLMALTGVPLLVWPKPLLDDWYHGGCQPDRAALELQCEVLASLKSACEAEGVIFPDKAPESN